jgi:putative hydrolase of the HAD superfamily
LDGYFDELAVSDEVGVGKPDPRIFQGILEKMGLATQEVLFVGDSLNDDYEGARCAGIDFVFYNRKRIPLEAHLRPAYTIERLDELEYIL